MESSYPVYYQYGKYSVNFTELTEDDVYTLRRLVKSLGVKLQYKGVNI